MISVCAIGEQNCEKDDVDVRNDTRGRRRHAPTKREGDFKYIINVARQAPPTARQ